MPEDKQPVVEYGTTDMTAAALIQRAVRNPFNSNGIGDYYIRCDECGASTSDVRCETYKQAAERWNTRATPPADAALVAALQKMVNSANPHPEDNPSMFAAWREARALLAATGTPSEGE